MKQIIDIEREKPRRKSKLNPDLDKSGEELDSAIESNLKIPHDLLKKTIQHEDLVPTSLQKINLKQLFLPKPKEPRMNILLNSHEGKTTQLLAPGKGSQPFLSQQLKNNIEMPLEPEPKAAKLLAPSNGKDKSNKSSSRHINHKRGESVLKDIHDYGKVMYLTNWPLPGEELLPIPKIAATPRNMAPSFDIKIVGCKDLDVRTDEQYLENIDLTLKEFMYIHCMNFYEKTYGFPMQDIPAYLLQSKEYMRINIERGMQLFSLFNLSPSEQWLFRFALLLDALPLPPEILESKVEGRKEYVFLGYTLKNLQRPPYFYVLETIQCLKKRVKSFPEWRANTETVFYDSIGRKCQNINIEQVYRDWIQLSTNSKNINFVDNQRAKASELSEDGMKVNKKNHRVKVNSIMTKRYGLELVEDLNSSKHF